MTPEKLFHDLLGLGLNWEVTESRFERASGTVFLEIRETSRLWEQVRCPKDTCTCEATRKEPHVINHWYNLARLDYLCRSYDSALQAINHALEIPTENATLRLNLSLRKAVILAEMGFATQSRPLLIQAKEIFALAADKIKRAQDLYNLANVLSVLGETEEAGRLYAECLDLKPEFAQAWKNYGSVFVATGHPEKGIECFDKAIEIEPNLVEAYLSNLIFRNRLSVTVCISKGTEFGPTLLQTFFCTPSGTGTLMSKMALKILLPISLEVGSLTTSFWASGFECVSEFHDFRAGARIGKRFRN